MAVPHCTSSTLLRRCRAAVSVRRRVISLTASASVLSLSARPARAGSSSCASCTMLQVQAQKDHRLDVDRRV